MHEVKTLREEEQKGGRSKDKRTSEVKREKEVKKTQTADLWSMWRIGQTEDQT